MFQEAPVPHTHALNEEEFLEANQNLQSKRRDPFLGLAGNNECISVPSRSTCGARGRERQVPSTYREGPSQAQRRNSQARREELRGPQPLA
jgi:hypothetical protein